MSRDASTGRWNYTQLAGAILKGLLDYDNALPKARMFEQCLFLAQLFFDDSLTSLKLQFDRFKHAALSLPALFSRSVCDYFDADVRAAGCILPRVC